MCTWLIERLLLVCVCVCKFVGHAARDGPADPARAFVAHGPLPIYPMHSTHAADYQRTDGARANWLFRWAVCCVRLKSNYKNCITRPFVTMERRRRQPIRKRFDRLPIFFLCFSRYIDSESNFYDELYTQSAVVWFFESDTGEKLNSHARSTEHVKVKWAPQKKFIASIMMMQVFHIGVFIVRNEWVPHLWSIIWHLNFGNATR